MSALAAGSAGRAAPAPAPAEGSAEQARSGRLSLALLSFLAVTALASLAYSELLQHPPAGSALAVAAIATACGGCVALVPRRPRLLTAALGGAIVLLSLVLGLLAADVPAGLVAPWHWGALARAVEGGLTGIANWDWPYSGGTEWARLSVVMLLVPATTAMAALCFWPARRGAGARRLLALAIAVALAVCGMSNAPTGAWRAEGLLLVLVLFAWLWLPTLRTFDSARALGWMAACAVPALILAPVFGSARSWIPFPSATAAGPTSFEWDQLYGPVGYSQSQQAMLSVRGGEAPGLLHVTSLDRFDGLRFIRSDEPPEGGQADIQASPAAEPSWYEHATITVEGLRSDLLVGGEGITTSVTWGLPSPPTKLQRAPDGTLLASPAPGGGFSYDVVSYAPRPTAAQMRAAPDTLPAAYTPYTEFELPVPSASALTSPELATEAAAAPSASRLARASSAGRILASPYAPMYTLARSLAVGAASRYDVVQRIERYLLSNYSYDERPPLRRYPLEAFLFTDRRGYCEQFSGAMTLMLRMEGVPARVGVGFKPAVFDPLTATWTVRAEDAHAWVEVFFAGIGWVSFDPTPTSPGSGSALSSGPASKGLLLEGEAHGRAGTRRVRPQRAVALPQAHRRAGSGLPLGVLLGALAAVLALLALGLAGIRLRRRGRRGHTGADRSRTEAALLELERALAAISAPRSERTTLSVLAARLERSAQPAAAAYVALLRELRFGRPRELAPGELAQARRNRLALRREIARGRGLRGRLRALRLIPPGPPPL